MTPRAYRAGLQRLAAAQKSGAGVPAYLRWVNRGLGRRAAAVAWVWGLTPNTVTVVSALLSLAGILVIAVLPVAPATAVAASVLLLAGYALDSADGQLARLAGSGSVAGEWLDHVIDAGRLPLVHVAVALMFLREGGAPGLIVAGLIFSIISSCWFFAQTLAEKLSPDSHSKRDGHEPAWVSFAKLPYDVGLLYLVIAFMWIPAFFATVYLALLIITGAVAVLSLRRKYRSLTREGVASSSDVDRR